MVLQDTWLFHGTIMDNIRYGKLDATEEEVIQAAKAAHVHHFIQTLPKGYDMVIDEEANNISQGQKQLLTIARVILKLQLSQFSQCNNSHNNNRAYQANKVTTRLLQLLLPVLLVVIIYVITSLLEWLAPRD